MSSPKSITETSGKKPQIPDEIQIGDFVVARFKSSSWADYLREIDKWSKPWIVRKIITEKEARKRVVAYARKQLGEPYSIATSKWNESKWYCSLLIYKSYSRSVTGMYLETYGRSYDIKAGPIVTPEDLVDSPRSRLYFIWEKEA